MVEASRLMIGNENDADMSLRHTYRATCICEKVHHVTIQGCYLNPLRRVFVTVTVTVGAAGGFQNHVIVR
jgi:hypothetical protein